MYSLKPYQLQAAQRIQNEGWQMILADEMGLGKTATALVGISERVKESRQLVICPASLKYNWCREIKIWLDIDVIPDDYSGPIVVTNYERLYEAEEYVRKGYFGGVIFDESHYLKNPKSNRTKLAIKIGRMLEYKLLLSGTPMVSGPADLAPQLDIMGLLPLFGGYRKFYQRYCNPIQTRWGWDYSGASNKKELQEKISRFIIRRTKKEVGIKLPNKNIIDIPVTYLRQPMADTFEKMGKYQKEVNDVKLPFSLDFINDQLTTNNSIVVFVHHKELMSDIYISYKSIACRIYGGQTMKARDKAVQQFQNGEKRLIICSLQASATGITLTRANTAIFLEYLWSPSVHQQAQGRIHRLTQKRPVTIYNLYCAGSIEEQKDMCAYVKTIDMEHVLP